VLKSNFNFQVSNIGSLWIHAMSERYC